MRKARIDSSSVGARGPTESGLLTEALSLAAGMAWAKEGAAAPSWTATRPSAAAPNNFRFSVLISSDID
jgi:hypothetical protein